jgi:outer membrane protein TolC
VQSERQNQALTKYEQTILLALEDVENAMVAYARELDRQESLDWDEILIDFPIHF